MFTCARNIDDTITLGSLVLENAYTRGTHLRGLCDQCLPIIRENRELKAWPWPSIHPIDGDLRKSEI